MQTTCRITHFLLALGMAAQLASCSTWLGNPSGKTPKGDQPPEGGPTKNTTGSDEYPPELALATAYGKDGAELGALKLSTSLFHVEAVVKPLTGSPLPPSLPGSDLPNPLENLTITIGDEDFDALASDKKIMSKVFKTAVREYSVQLLIRPKPATGIFGGDALEIAGAFTSGLDKTFSLVTRQEIAVEKNFVVTSEGVVGVAQLQISFSHKNVFDLTGSAASFEDIAEQAIVLDDNTSDPTAAALRDRLIENIKAQIEVSFVAPTTE